MPTGYIVGFYKHAFPTANVRSLVLAAVLAGQFSSLLLTMLSGGVRFSQAVISTVILQGIGASALSAGINTTNSSGDTKRVEAAKEEAKADKK